MGLVGSVRSLHRYPVKSMVGESLDVTTVSRAGVPGDRAWAVRNLDVGEQQGARKIPALLGLVATTVATDEPAPNAPPMIRFPDGEEWSADDPRTSEQVSAYVGKRVELVPLAPASHLAHYRQAHLATDGAELWKEMGVGAGEDAPDMSSLPLKKLAQLGVFVTPPGTYFDAYPLHILTTSSLRFVGQQLDGAPVDPCRYRPNLVIDSGEMEGLVEADWEGVSLEVGGCRFHVDAATVRCSIPGRAQAIEGIGADKQVVRAVAQHAARHLGVYASVTQPGSIRVGDPVHLIPRRKRPVADALRRAERSLTRGILRRALGEPVDRDS